MFHVIKSRKRSISPKKEMKEEIKDKIKEYDLNEYEEEYKDIKKELKELDMVIIKGFKDSNKLTVPFKLKKGVKITIKLENSDDTGKGCVNFKIDDNNIVYHYNPRPSSSDSRGIIHNTYTNGSWGSEECSKNLFIGIKKAKLVFKIKKDGIQSYVNKEKSYFYKHRNEIKDTKYLEFHFDKIKKVTIEKKE
jgi:hypothetical protein